MNNKIKIHKLKRLIEYSLGNGFAVKIEDEYKSIIISIYKNEKLEGSYSISYVTLNTLRSDVLISYIKARYKYIEKKAEI